MSYELTYIKRQGIKVDASQKVLDNPNQNNVPGVLDFLRAQSVVNAKGGLITGKLKQDAENSWLKNTEIIKLVTNKPTIVNERTFTSTYDQSSSSLVSITMAYIGFNIEVYPSEFLGYGSGEANMIAKAQAVERDMSAGMVEMGRTIEQLVLSKLLATKTKVVETPLNYLFEGDAIVATNAQRTQIIGSIPRFASGNNYPSEQMHVLSDQGTMQIVSEIQQNGANNSQNLAITLNGKTFYPTNAMAQAVGKEAQMFACPMGSAGILTRIQPLAKDNYKTGDGWEFGVLPANVAEKYGIPYEMEYRFKSEGADVTAKTGNAKDTASAVEYHHFGLDVAIITPLEADAAGAKTPVLQILVNTAATDADTTAPVVSTVESTATTEVTVNFSEVMAIDEAGSLTIAEIESDVLKTAFSITGSVTIDEAVATEDGTAIVFTIGGTTATGNTISSDTLYDGAGIKLTANSGQIAKVNTGNTAWEAV